jgi:tryptophan synthase beta chain
MFEPTAPEWIKRPDAQGYFAQYGGSFVPETLHSPLEALSKAYAHYQEDPQFLAELDKELAHFVGRPSPIDYAARLSQRLGGAQIFLKREDLNHTGAHKINSAVGQVLLAKRLGKTRIIAETGAGQHGVATATVCARHGLECVVYMGEEDMQRQSPNVYRMKLLGAKVVPVTSGSRTLKDALNEAMRDWVAHVDNTFYIIGTVAGPHPYPKMVRNFQSIIGRECLVQMPAMLEAEGLNEGKEGLPTVVMACVGGGSNAMGIFYPYLPHAKVRLIGVEAGGLGVNTVQHAASLTRGSTGVLHGSRTSVLQDEDGQIMPTHSVSAGLDYPGVGPEHAWLRDTGRVEYVAVQDDEALEAFYALCRLEGIIPALESSHAIAYAMTLAPKMKTDESILVCLSGRGDKDMGTVMEMEHGSGNGEAFGSTAASLSIPFSAAAGGVSL